MKLPFSFFLALRYLQPKRTFVSIITLISVVGVMLGVMVLILVISVMTGFDRELRQKVIDFDTHILISTEDVLRDWRDLTVKVRNTPGVVGTAPYVQGPVIVEFEHKRLAPLIRGIDPAEEEKVVPFQKFLKKGAYDLEGDSALVGVELARKLQIDVGDKLTVYSPGNLGEILDGIKELEKTKAEDERQAIDKLREVVLPKELTITGIFETGHYLHDSEFLLVPIHVGQELYGLGDALHGLRVRTTDPYGAESVKQEIQKFLQPPEYAQTWIDMNNQYFEAVRLERTVMFFLLFFIIIVAAFGIMNTLITVTVQKTRDIGIMKAIGANIRQIVWVFLGQGVIVGLFGTLAGLGLGMTLIQYRNEFSQWLASTLGIEVFPKQVYQFSQIPAQVVPMDVAKICIGAFIVCCVFAFLPAYRAARLDPVTALRYE
ncbi:MAG TPA: ABC transporter permease [Chthoniobacterales bacterium]|nr:ABC transporter permease [Chthoniobacterales bacterium]